MTETDDRLAGHRTRRTAKAPSRGKGLKIKRVFTTAGVHPYDEVTWERRDVVMTNWRDGSINFEQRGVEFPVRVEHQRHQHRHHEVLPRRGRQPAAGEQPAPAHRPGRADLRRGRP